MYSQNQNRNSDIRYFPRWHVASKVSYQLLKDSNENHHVYEGKTKDLSCSGACICMDTKENGFVLHDNIKLAIQLLDSRVVRVHGEILWVKIQDNVKQVGVVFHSIPDEVQELILQYAFEVDRDELLSQWYKGWDGGSPK